MGDDAYLPDHLVFSSSESYASSDQQSEPRCKDKNIMLPSKGALTSPSDGTSRASRSSSGSRKLEVDGGKNPREHVLFSTSPSQPNTERSDSSTEYPTLLLRPVKPPSNDVLPGSDELISAPTLLLRPLTPPANDVLPGSNELTSAATLLLRPLTPPANEVLPGSNEIISAPALLLRPVMPPASDVLPGSNELISVGSALHWEDKCKPCLFFNNPIGCQTGVDCEFCHLAHDRKNKPRPCKGKRKRFRKLFISMEQEESQAQQQDNQGAQLGPPNES